MAANIETEQIEFFQLSNPDPIIQILYSRLPYSSSLYNVAKSFEFWRVECRWFVLGKKISKDSWIVEVTTKEGFGQEVLISGPLGSKMIGDVKEAFRNFKEIDWNGNVIFSNISSEISPTVSEMSVRDHGNVTIIRPCISFHMSISDALLIDDNFELENGIVLSDLNTEIGNNFILSTWKYTQSSDEFVKKLLSFYPSAGIYVDGAPISAAGVTSYGLIGMLFTVKEHRNKGYAKYCIKSIVKKLAILGLIPSSTVQLGNEASIGFQKKMGFTQGPLVDYVICEKPVF